ncbi:hypothetical protein BV911_00960 [Pseudoruegeria sp. SK021]|nr:hypothetical protein BV911_00960 [Pseudoruegeria sp. SK021]
MLRPILVCLCAMADPALAAAPEVVAVTADKQGSDWRFDVTLLHPDTGWDHYADGWQIETADGTVLGQRELLHPHETEQPFTRSLPAVAIPTGTQTVILRPRCSMDGWSETGFSVQLTP